uniref:Glabrous enhancer-binding protein-like DBD domain-containing protein n=1 Tax=Leersia perrieri TaxID=77586 RepID=A0A0D9UZ36_9ORYZ
MAAAEPAATYSGEEDDEGTDSDGSNPDHAAAPLDPPPPVPDASVTPPPPAPEPTTGGAIPPQPGSGTTAEDSRRLFQRLWTDEEELLILRGFLDFTTRRGTKFASHQYDTGPFYDEIRRRLSFDFTKSQLVEKLRRLKKKYRVCAARMAAAAANAQGGGGAAFAFRSAHEGAIYDVARHIWPPALKRGDGAASDEDDINPAATTTPGAMEDGFGGGVPAPASTPTPRGRGGRRVRRRTAQEPDAPAMGFTLPALNSTDGAHQEPVVAAMEYSIPQIADLPLVSEPAPVPVNADGASEEAVRSILSPLLKELISSVAVAGQTGTELGLGIGFGGLGCADISGVNFGTASMNPGVPSIDKWRQQQILELEVYLKRIELVREQVTAALEDLRSCLLDDAFSPRISLFVASGWWRRRPHAAAVAAIGREVAAAVRRWARRGARGRARRARQRARGRARRARRALLADLLPSLLQFLLGLLAGVLLLLLLGLVILHGDYACGEAFLLQLAHDAHRVDSPDHRHIIAGEMGRHTLERGNELTAEVNSVTAMAPLAGTSSESLSFDSTKIQLVEKLCRLKKKYRVCAARKAAATNA